MNYLLRKCHTISEDVTFYPEDEQANLMEDIRNLDHLVTMILIVLPNISCYLILPITVNHSRNLFITHIFRESYNSMILPLVMLFIWNAFCVMLFVSLCLYLPLSLSLFLSVSLCLSLSLSLSLSPSLHLSVSLCLSLSLSPTLLLFVSLCLSFSLFLSLCLSLSFSLSFSFLWFYLLL